MAAEYDINALAKEDSWRMFRLIGEFVEGLDKLNGIEPAVSIYGSARIKPGDELYTRTEEIANKLGEMGFSIVTGGGPGVMEAANRGALKAGVTSVGLNIDLPEQQLYNDFTTKSVSFRHFFVRKVMLVKYATAFIIMPGGMGTLDELTEVLTLIQTHKIKPFPVILFDSKFWEGFLGWLHQTVLNRGMVSVEDFNLLRVCDEPAAVADIVQKWYIKQEIIGKKAVSRS
ncbi:MAG: TIGR00730 family Rossman fold protein [Dehalococcoidales bacterium]|nr:TIGR00730 family Rossman fold protein [Dehalococcoidales bacterium]